MTAKKPLSAFVAGTMFLSIAAVPAFAEKDENSSGDEPTYEIIDADSSVRDESPVSLQGDEGIHSYADVADMQMSLMDGGNISTVLNTDVADVTTENGVSTYTLKADVELIDTDLWISADESAVIDLNGHSITQKTVEYNAIWNGGTMVIKDTVGTGKIIGDWHGVSNAGILTIEGGTITTPASCGIYSQGTLTVNGGTVIGAYSGICNGGGNITINEGTVLGVDDGNALTCETVNDEYEEPVYEGIDSTVTINGGTFNGSYCLDIWAYKANINSGTFIGKINVDSHTAVNITGGDLSGVSSARIEGDVIVGENVGKIKCDEVTTTAGAYNLFDCENITLIGEITEGTYDVVRLTGVTIPEGSNPVINLKPGAKINGYTKIYGGTFNGSTVSEVKSSVLFGGTYSTALKESIDKTDTKYGAYTFYNGYGWEKSIDSDRYEVKTIEKFKLTIKSNNAEAGKLANLSYDIQSGGVGGSMDETFEKECSKNAVAILKSLRAECKDPEKYLFVGWYYNENGEGTPISTALEVAELKLQITEDTTLYAVFKASDTYQTLIDDTNSWLNDETGSEKTELEIHDKYDMEKFAYAVNSLGKTFNGKTVTLTADLDYSQGAESAETNYMPIGVHERAFNGTFDGGNHTISGVHAEAGYCGIFGETGSSAIIKNLNIKNSTFKSYGFTAMAGAIAGNTTGTITKCTVTGCTIESGHFAAVVVEHTWGAKEISDIVVSNCTVNGTTDTAVVAGYMEGNITIKNITITNTKSNGAALLGDANAGAGEITVSDIDIDMPENTLITMSNRGGTINITGDNTVNTNEIAQMPGDNLNINIYSGTYTAPIDDYVPVEETDEQTQKPYTWTQTSTDTIL